jgi:hypothetical protein
MNLEDLIKKISVLEDESRANNKALSVLNTNFKKLEDSNASFLDTARELRKEVERLGGIISRLGQFDPNLSQVRVDFAKKFNEVDAQQKKVELMISKARKENQDEIIKNQDSVKDLLNTWFEKEKQSMLEVESRLNKKVLEIQNNYENDIKRDESIRIAATASVEVTERLSKKLESILGDVENVKKRLEDVFQKSQITSDDIRKNESRLNELASMENQRKLDQSRFIDQQSVLQMEHDRTWKEWNQQFSEISKKTGVVLQEINIQTQDVKRSRDGFNEISQRFERRMNELTEMYRILEERLRQDWATYKTDEQKRWSNYSLIFGEKQGDFLNQFENTKNRMTALEDRTREIQDVFVMVSAELQKGMQGLMQMVNNWIQTFDDIRGSSQSKKSE